MLVASELVNYNSHSIFTVRGGGNSIYGIITLQGLQTSEGKLGTSTLRLDGSLRKNALHATAAISLLLISISD